MTLLSPPQPLLAGYPNHLAGPEPERLRLPGMPWLLLLLVVLCLAPRILMALRIPSVCPDGVLYIRIAQAIDGGNLRTAFDEMSLNVYPVILMLLHRLGLDWNLAAVVWGVTISSLVVLPLWGWARRQFDDRVALVACLLYVVHPKFIEWSPEAIRDSTFWFLFMLAIYLMWRAITEVRYGYFIAAGAAITLASVTRTEGLFLLLPLGLWTFWRWRALATGRRKLLVGATLCVVVFPALLALVNVIWLCGHSGWVGVRISPLMRVQSWLESLFGGVMVGSENDSVGSSLTLGRMIRMFVPTMTRGLGPLFALLMFGGIWKWRRLWARRDHQVLFWTALLIMCGIWIQLWFGKSICPRYALPIVLMGSVFAALGLLSLIAGLRQVVQGLAWQERRQRAMVVIVAAMVAAIGVVDAMTCNREYYATRRAAVAVGDWVRHEVPAPAMLVGPVGITPIISYYAHNGPYQVFCWEVDEKSVIKVVEQTKADVVLLQPSKRLTADQCASLADRMSRHGMKLVGAHVLPDMDPNLSILVRASKLDFVQEPVDRR